MARTGPCTHITEGWEPGREEEAEEFGLCPKQESLKRVVKENNIVRFMLWEKKIVGSAELRVAWGQQEARGEDSWGIGRGI